MQLFNLHNPHTHTASQYEWNTPKWHGQHQVLWRHLTWVEYLTRRRSASQPLSQTRSCLSISSSLFSRPQDSSASLIFLSQSTRRRSISFRRLRLASMASRRRPFLATLTNSNSCKQHQTSESLHVWYMQGHSWRDYCHRAQCSTGTGCDTCWRLRLACTAAASFSSCLTLILTISCSSFSLASLESRPEYSICLRVSISGQTGPDSQTAPSWARATLWGVRVWETLVQADGGEAREEGGTGPEGEKDFTLARHWCKWKNVVLIHKEWGEASTLALCLTKLHCAEQNLNYRPSPHSLSLSLIYCAINQGQATFFSQLYLYSPVRWTQMFPVQHHVCWCHHYWSGTFLVTTELSPFWSFSRLQSHYTQTCQLLNHYPWLLFHL